MKHSLLALALVAAAAPVAAQQGEGVDHSQDLAWQNQQTLALARRAAEGWYALPGGLLWRRVAGDGSGPAPTVDDTVTVNYEGTLVDGTKFDSSWDRGEPATFPLRGLVPAWQLAIPQMGVGDTIEIAAPASLAYGPRGRGPIPGGATLLFRIELLGIEGVETP
ncbi:FKBP-type peptidyl-prolyl cis-trans isomerase [Altererythrobacter sp. B11]|uniref:FKBP-type peptidyl-prolyl cis-trans isomerase n=1 Tax=Altererythrobacter sp. B11 TaxID=2060312 RepID=UPI000E5BFA06|nr:FKBP-type peptidyl-prolyl cis-trans isomerase [Altererythrobacter sp. B11]